MHMIWLLPDTRPPEISIHTVYITVRSTMLIFAQCFIVSTIIQGLPSARRASGQSFKQLRPARITNLLSQYLMCCFCGGLQIGNIRARGACLSLLSGSGCIVLSCYNGIGVGEGFLDCFCHVGLW